MTTAQKIESMQAEARTLRRVARMMAGGDTPAPAPVLEDLDVRIRDVELAVEQLRWEVEEAAWFE